MDKKTPGLVKAIERAGSAAALARQLNISRQAVGDWHSVPAERVRDVESITGVPRHELRPDLFDPPGNAA